MKRVFSAVCFLFVMWPLSSHAVMWSVPLGESGRHELGFELDPYYSTADYTFATTKEPIPKLTVESEKDIYLYMLSNIYKPRYILFEASVNPLPIAGVMIRKYQNDFYRDAQVTDRINVVRSLTDGFPDPGALSIFFGNVADFVVGDSKKLVGKGYSGLLISAGNFHIVNNLLIKDYWQECEIKVKGDDEREKLKLNWSYAIGVRLHRNENIKQTFYFSIKRTRVDFLDSSSFSFFDFFVRNSSQQVRIDFSLANPKERGLTRFYFLAGKNVTFFDSNLTLSLNLGFLKIKRSGYSGALSETIDTHWSFLVQPGVQFNF